MKRYEYEWVKERHLEPEKRVGYLNGRGEEGWLLVYVTYLPPLGEGDLPSDIYLFVREKEA